jgi:hypothetical protein
MEQVGTTDNTGEMGVSSVSAEHVIDVIPASSVLRAA